MTRAMMMTAALSMATASAADKVIQAFEGDGFGDWEEEGSAFGKAPVVGEMEGLDGKFTNYSGGGLASSAHGGNSATGSLTSPEFTLTENYLAFLIAGGNHPGKTAVQLLVGGEVVKEETGRNNLTLRTVVWDVSDLKGKQVRLRIIDRETGDWGLIAVDHFLMTGNPNPKFPPPEQKSGGLAGMVATQAIPGLAIPPGSTARVVADHDNQGVTSPTALAFDEQGVLYVAETNRFRFGVEDNRNHLYWLIDDLSLQTVEDRAEMYEKFRDKVPLDSMTAKTEVVRRLADQGDDGVFKDSSVYADDFDDQLDGTLAGIFAYEGTVYLANIPKIYALRDRDGDGKADERGVIEDGFGVRVSFSGHDLNGFALGQDGRIYSTIGDRGFNVVTKEGVEYPYPSQGAIFRFDPDGSNFEVIHIGLRNPKEIAFDDYGNGISVDNNSDHGDGARIVYIVDGADSGWRMGHQVLQSFHRQIGMEERPPSRWLVEKMSEEANPEHPAWMLPPVANLTAGPSGLTYHPGVGFLESEVGRFLICDYRGGASASGIWSFEVAPEGAGMKLVDGRRFSWGAAATDVEYSWDGRVFVTDFIGGWTSHDAGRVFEIAAEEVYKEDEAKQAAELIAEGFEMRDTAELAGLLSHGDQRVRTRAQLALTRKSDGLAALGKAAKEGTGLERLHGVWGLGVIARRGAAVLPGGSDGGNATDDRRGAAFDALLPLLEDEDAEVRAQTAKVIGEAGVNDGGVDFSKLLRDESLRVRMFAAIAAGRSKSLDSLPAIRTMLAENGDADPYLRHAGSYALELLSAPGDLAALSRDDAAAVRMAAVIALGRLKHERLADFLGDADPAVAREAARMIHDRDIEEVRPMVAALLDDESGIERSEMMWRRLLHSAFRLGDSENVRRVLGVAFDDRKPMAVRSEAMRLLDEWNEPHPVNQSLGRYAPLPARDAEVAKSVLQEDVSRLLSIDGKLLEAAIEVVETHGLDYEVVSDEHFKALVNNKGLPGGARAKALDLYTARQPANLGRFLVELAGAPDDALALTAIRKLVAAGAPEAVEAVRRAVESDHAGRKQQAWAIAAELEDPAIVELFVGEVKKLTETEGKSPAAIELLDAARKRPESEVKQAVERFDAKMASLSDPLAKWNVTLLGGNAASGRKLFESHPAAQCMRCHMDGKGDGDGVANAGPSLAGVATRGDRRYMLESMIEPGAVITPGYGVVAVTLKRGESTGGTLIKEDDDSIELDIAGEKRVIPRAEVAEMSEPVSAMPPVGTLLQPAEIRDLVEWLMTLDKS